MTDVEVKKKLKRLLSGGALELNAEQLLKKVNREFPIPGSAMGKSFHGLHHITLVGNKICVSVWANGCRWDVTAE